MNFQADNTLCNNSVEYDLTKDPAKRRHYVKSCPQKNQQLHQGSSQSQITTGLLLESVSDNQPEKAFGEIDE